MTCKAMYRGLKPVLGVTKDQVYTLDFSTRPGRNGDKYMWVSIRELPEFLMPYASMVAMFREWNFLFDEDRHEYIDHLRMVDNWMEIYAPAEATA